MTFESTSIPGVLSIRGDGRSDDRGCLQKYFERANFAERGLCVDFAEDLCTVSRRGVLRGMHFQIPPAAQAKVVCCVAGKVLDVVLDLRVGSPAYGTCLAVELVGGSAQALYLPEGVAHGFVVRSEEAVLTYKLSRPFVPECEAGVHWASFGFSWPWPDPVVSPRDHGLPGWPGFRSPFRLAWEA
jgi:dTDP-4-dehydrorhamnose 3,5-epimerase